MAANNTGDVLNSETAIKTVETSSLTIKGHLLKWSGVTIQVSNISLIGAGNVPAPKFPAWSIILTIVGAVVLGHGSLGRTYFANTETTVGFTFLLVGLVWLSIWKGQANDAKLHKYLHILLNSGDVYSIRFSDMQFLDEVLQVFENIFVEGPDAATSYYINIKDSKIGAVIQE